MKKIAILSLLCSFVLCGCTENKPNEVQYVPMETEITKDYFSSEYYYISIEKQSMLSNIEVSLDINPVLSKLQDFKNIFEKSKMKIEEINKQKETKIKEEELRHLSAIIYAEAGNQCMAGQQAVGIVVMERVKCEEFFEDDVISVIYEPRQFSPVKSGNFKKALKKYDRGELPESCIEAAKYALMGNTVVNYNGKDYDLKGYLFFSRYIKDRRLVIQDHHFK
jgi:hypothetical protein